MKNKVLILSLCLLVAVTLFGCGAKGGDESNPQSLTEAIGEKTSSSDTGAAGLTEKETQTLTEAMTEAPTQSEAESTDGGAALPTVTDNLSQSTSDKTELSGTEYEEPHINFSDLE